MEIFTGNFSHKVKLTDFFQEDNLCFFDIETTGLNRNQDIIYLIGVLYYNKQEKCWTLKQFFAEDEIEEKAILNEFVQLVSQFYGIITYNGDSFDIPFVKTKLKKYNLNFDFAQLHSIDLYRIIRQNRNYLNLENLKLKTIERSLNIYREDIYSGKDCIGFYKDYLESKDPILKARVLQHNYDDLFYVLDILEILNIIQKRKSFNLKVEGQNKTFYIEDIALKGDLIYFGGLIEEGIQQELKYFDNNFSILIQDFNRFFISFEYKQGYITPDKICIFIDTREYHNLINLSNEVMEYKVPDYIFVLSIEKIFLMNNIKNLLKSLLLTALN